MSLQVLAQDMASRGRGPDTMLVHMAPKEVYGLQALARAHGGSLSINPQTGLPEAGFLSSLLPTLIGVGLTVATGGAVTPLMAGLGVGGLQALRTGSLSKGLMAGLGAYGGAGLMGGVMGAGAGAVGAAPSALDAGANVYQGTGNIGMTGLDAGMSAYPSAGTIGAPVGLDAGMSAYPSTGAIGAPVGLDAGMGTYPASVVTPAPVTATEMPPPPPQISPYAATNIQPATPTQVAKAGVGEVFKDPSKFLTKDNLKYGLAALSPALFQEKKSAQAPVDREQMQFAFDPGRLETPTQVGGIGEYTFFRPSYTRLNPTTKMAAEGGTMTSDYTYDPETQLYSREKTPPQQDRASSGNAGPYTMGAPDAAANGFQNLTPAEQAAFFAENPNMAAITQTAQKGFGLTSLGMLQGLVNPNFVSRQESIAQGINPDIADPSMESAGLNPGDTGISAATEAAGSGPSTAGSDSPGEKRGGIIRRAAGGISHLGDYSDGGRLLRGPGDGVSDSIPATIANKRPARLADGEFVVPARIVSELGNGSTEAGARKLYAMMDRIQKNRTKSVGKDKVAVNSRSEQLLPA